jgi:hypothetical protein
MASNPKVVARRSVSAAACRSIRTARRESSRGYSSTTTGVGVALDAGTLRLGRWTGSCATGFTTDSSTASPDEQRASVSARLGPVPRLDPWRSNGDAATPTLFLQNSTRAASRRVRDRTQAVIVAYECGLAEPRARN